MFQIPNISILNSEHLNSEYYYFLIQKCFGNSEYFEFGGKSQESFQNLRKVSCTKCRVPGRKKSSSLPSRGRVKGRGGGEF